MVVVVVVVVVWCSGGLCDGGRGPGFYLSSVITGSLFHSVTVHAKKAVVYCRLDLYDSRGALVRSTGDHTNEYSINSHY